MAAYQAIFILRPDLDQEAIDRVCGRVSLLVTEQQGLVTSLEKLGQRRLAYEVKGHTDGSYVVLNYEGPPKATAELERLFRIADEVIRYLVVRQPAEEAAGAKKPAAEEAGAQAHEPARAEADEPARPSVAEPVPEGPEPEPEIGG